MLKRIVFGALVLGISGVLIVGAINRTNDRLERETRSNEDRQGRQSAITEDPGQRYGGGQGEGQGERRQALDANVQLGQGNQANRQGKRGSDEIDEVVELLQTSGVVTAVDDDALVFDSAAGETLVIEGRTWMYARDQGFEADVGDQLELTGFYEDGEWKSTGIVNISKGLSLAIRGNSGRPMFAGQGRQGS